MNDLNLNLALARLLAPASASSNYNFDNLFVPFRCMASEVFTRQVVEQKSGALSDAIRNSMSFPLAFRPIRNLDGKYYYDGAVYDNFPTNTMKKTFAPDIIIGVNVGDVAMKKYPKNDDALLGSTVAFLGTSVADTGSVGPNGIYIQPDLEGMGVGDFDRVKDFIAEGDTAARFAAWPKSRPASAGASIRRVAAKAAAGVSGPGPQAALHRGAGARPAGRPERVRGAVFSALGPRVLAR